MRKLWIWTKSAAITMAGLLFFNVMIKFEMESVYYWVFAILSAATVIFPAIEHWTSVFNKLETYKNEENTEKHGSEETQV